MGPGQAVKSVYSKYAKFSGRATRSEFWWFYLFYVVVLLVLAGIDQVTGLQFGSASYDYTMNNETNHVDIDGVVGILSSVFSLVTLLPLLAVMARRFHDAGHSGLWIIWSYLLAFFCLIGFIIAIVFWCQKSEPGDTKYGPHPTT